LDFNLFKHLYIELPGLLVVRLFGLLSKKKKNKLKVIIYIRKKTNIQATFKKLIYLKNLL
jgi:hypothetical protein